MDHPRRGAPNTFRAFLGGAALATLIPLGLVACGTGDVVAEIDQVFTPGQQAEIRRAGTSWNAFTSREVHFAGGGQWLILSAATPKGLGLAEGERHIIRIDPRTPEGQHYAVALHELGHALGLHHVKQGVMDADRQTITFSEDDMAECRRVGACD